MRQLQPWFANVGKRQVRSPKIYIRESGLLHRLLGLADRHALTDLELDRLVVVHAGRQSFPLTRQIDAVSAEQLLSGATGLGPPA